MAMLVKVTKSLTDRLPKLISPGVHAVIDYATATAFLVAAFAFWKRNPPAGISAMLASGSEFLLSAMTDYPGGLTRDIDFPAHGRIDVGLTLLTATLPTLMNFSDKPEARFFNMQAIGMAAVAGLTDFTGTGERKQLKKLEKAA
jgi:hypothetical protein